MLTAEYPPFRPMTMCTGPHQQTLAAFFVRGRLSRYRAEKHVVPLDDGDRLVIHDDRPNSWITGDRIAVLFHGLSGCHSSPYMVRTTDKLRRNAVRTIRVDMRGCGDSALISKSHVHAGCSQDVRAIVRFLEHLSPLSRISLIGYSLGGNVVLKTLGEWGVDHPQQVDSAVVVSPPADLMDTSLSLRRHSNQIYERFFMRQLRNQVVMRRRKVKNLIDNGVSPIPYRLIHFDDQFTGPIWGYRGVREYYEHSSAGPLMKYVHVPTVIVAAKDDPIVPFSTFQKFEMSDHIDLVVTKNGGHLGYLARKGRDPDRFWLEWRVTKWVSSMDDV